MAPHCQVLITAIVSGVESEAERITEMPSFFQSVSNKALPLIVTCFRAILFTQMVQVVLY